MLPYLKLYDNVAILEYVNRLVSKLDSNFFDTQINTYSNDSLLYSFAFGNLLNIQSLVGEGFVYSGGEGSRNRSSDGFTGQTPSSREEMNRIYSALNDFTDTNYKLQISISGKSIDSYVDLYLSNTLKASGVIHYFPLKVSTPSGGHYLLYSSRCSKLSRLLSLNFNRSNKYLANNYHTIFCKLLNVDFFINKMHSLVIKYGLSPTSQVGWNKMFALVIDTRISHYLNNCNPPDKEGFTSYSLRYCVDPSLASMVDLYNYTSIAFVFGMSSVSYMKFREYGMDFIFGCFV